MFLRDIWPSQQQIQDAIRSSVKSEQFREQYADVFEGDDDWRALDVPTGELFAWDDQSTYIRKPPYFDGMKMQPARRPTSRRARAGDARRLRDDRPHLAGRRDREDVARREVPDAARGRARRLQHLRRRRGNHEVMVRGTFANIRLRNQLAPGTEGGFTRHLPRASR